jgi:hypothetical protein
LVRRVTQSRASDSSLAVVAVAPSEPTSLPQTRNGSIPSGSACFRLYTSTSVPAGISRVFSNTVSSGSIRTTWTRMVRATSASLCSVIRWSGSGSLDAYAVE